MTKKYPRVLVISHNTFSLTLNNGKTYSSIFGGWPKDRIAQLFFQKERPDFNVCRNFYHITDDEILLKSKKNIGKKISQDASKSIKKTLSPLHSYIRRKPMPVFNFIRNALWSTKKWNNHRLNEWLIDFNPEAIFFVGGPSSFSYKITKFIAQKFEIPIFLYYTDDYITPIKTRDPFWWANYFFLKRSLNHILYRVNCIFVIGEDMAKEFSLKLNKRCIPIMNAVNVDDYSNKIVVNSNRNVEFAYFGGLHLNRWKTLLTLADSLKEINEEKKMNMTLSIYSGNILDETILEKFNKHPNINFKGSVNSQEIIEEMQIYDVLVHVESFEEKMISKTRLSISTKIPEYLASGKVILGVGPKELSSIRYLEKLGFTFIIDTVDTRIAKSKIKSIIAKRDEFGYIGEQSIEVAKNNHSIDYNKEIIREIISNGVKNYN